MKKYDMKTYDPDLDYLIRKRNLDRAAVTPPPVLDARVEKLRRFAEYQAAARLEGRSFLQLPDWERWDRVLHPDIWQRLDAAAAEPVRKREEGIAKVSADLSSAIEAVQKAEPDLPHHKAVAKVFRTNPSLRRQYDQIKKGF